MNKSGKQTIKYYADEGESDNSDSYEDFYERSLLKANADEIIKQGGGINEFYFKQAAKSNMKSGYSDVLKNNKLTKAIFEKHFEKKGNIQILEYKTRTGREQSRFQVGKGKKIEIAGKVYKGGAFLPKTYLKSY